MWMDCTLGRCAALIPIVVFWHSRAGSDLGMEANIKRAVTFCERIQVAKRSGDDHLRGFYGFAEQLKNGQCTTGDGRYTGAVYTQF